MNNLQCTMIKKLPESYNCIIVNYTLLINPQFLAVLSNHAHLMTVILRIIVSQKSWKLLKNDKKSDIIRKIL